MSFSLVTLNMITIFLSGDPCSRVTHHASSLFWKPSLVNLQGTGMNHILLTSLPHRSFRLACYNETALQV